MPGSFKTEAIVLRSIRYGEADRILHLYSRERGRIGAVAKGVRRPKSRFGGRLEPLFRVGLVLHEGRGELCTVTSVADRPRPRRAARDARRRSRAPPRRARRSCGCSTARSRTSPAYNLLCHELALLDASPAAAGRAQALAFRLKLLLAAGFVPELGACASCGEREHLGAFSAGAGGVVCAACEAGSFPLDPAGARVPRRRARAARSPRRRTRPSSALGAGRPRDRRDARAPRPRASRARRGLS